MKLSKIMAALALGAGALAWLAAGHHPASSERANAEGSADSGWNIHQEKDKLTDQITTEAGKIYPVDGGGKIEAIARCSKPVAEGEWKFLQGFMRRPVNGIEFEFDYFAANDDEAKQPESSFEHTQAFTGVTAVEVTYRLDSKEVKTFLSYTDYKNQALLLFPTIDVAKNVNAFNAMDGTPLLPATEELLQTRLFRVRLPVLGGRTADIEIHPADLHDLFAACPATKALLESPAASNSGDTNTAAQTASDDQSAPNEFKTTDWTKNLPPNKLMHSEMAGVNNNALPINDYDPSTYPKETASATPPAPSGAPANNITGERTWLGVKLQPVTSDIAASVGLSQPAGVQVTDMVQEGPAAKAGIISGDIILKFDENEINEAQDLPSLVAATPSGKQVNVVIWHKGEMRTVFVTVETVQQ